MWLACVYLRTSTEVDKAIALSDDDE